MCPPSAPKAKKVETPPPQYLTNRETDNAGTRSFLANRAGRSSLRIGLGSTGTPSAVSSLAFEQARATSSLNPVAPGATPAGPKTVAEIGGDRPVPVLTAKQQKKVSGWQSKVEKWSAKGGPLTGKQQKKLNKWSSKVNKWEVAQGLAPTNHALGISQLFNGG